MRSIRCLQALAALAVAFTVCGCGPRTVKVTGRLVKNGEVQTFPEDAYVTVSFRPENDGDTVPATLKRTEGTYEVELPPGRYRVVIFVPPKDSKTRPGPPAGDKAAGQVYEFKTSTTQDLTLP